MSGTFDVDIFFSLLPRSRTDTLLREKRAVFLLMESWQNGKTDKAFPRKPIAWRLSKDGLCFNGNATPKIGKALPRPPVNRPSGLPTQGSRTRALPLIGCRASRLGPPDSGLPMRDSPSTSDVRPSSEPIAITKEHFCKT